MGPAERFTFSFVDYIPEDLDDGHLYVSVEFATTVHKCACGCGREVVTPLSPTDWALMFDGDTVSLDPSIGNWGFECRSHYWITQNRIVWAPRWSEERIRAGRVGDRAAKGKYFGTTENQRAASPDGEAAAHPTGRTGDRLWINLWKRVKRGVAALWP